MCGPLELVGTLASELDEEEEEETHGEAGEHERELGSDRG